MPETIAFRFPHRDKKEQPWGLKYFGLLKGAKVALAVHYKKEGELILRDLTISFQGPSELYEGLWGPLAFGNGEAFPHFRIDKLVMTEALDKNGALVNNYTVKDGRTLANGLDFDTGITVSNGGLNAPLTDMAEYLKFLVGAPGLTDDARNVLSRGSIEEMWRPVLPNIQGDGQPAGSVGLSCFITDTNGTRIIGHTGSQASFRSFFYLNPDTHSAIIAVFNTVAEDEGQHPSVAPLFEGLWSRYVERIVPALRPGSAH